MIPIGDEPRTRLFPIINLLIIISCIAVFVWQISEGKHYYASTIENYGLIPDRLLKGEALFTIITSMFLHGGIIHLAGNMLFLYIFGDNIEDIMGHLRFLVFYLLSGAVGSAAWVFLNMDPSTPVVGASGAISGVLGAYFLSFPSSRITYVIPVTIFIIPIKLPAWFMIGSWFLYQLTLAYIAPMSNVAFWVHVFGFIFGLIFSSLFIQRKLKER